MSQLKPASDAIYRRVCESREFFDLFMTEVCRASINQGAEAMRTALLQRVSWGSDVADRIRAEPVPEDE
jgi:hypothetical protein